jgi:TfoX/Sxy family transcriptional regulator of competence genes
MSYDEEIADRVREVAQHEAGLTEKRMFGGLAFLVHGAMAVAASSRGGLMVRVDPAEAEELLADPAARPFEMRGRELAGWLHIGAEGLQTDEQLERWVTRGLAYARSLPARAAGAGPSRRARRPSPGPSSPAATRSSAAGRPASR